MSDTQSKSTKSNSIFLVFFAFYTAGAILLLLAGLASAFASVSVPLRNLFDSLGQDESALAQVWRGIVRVAPLTEPTWQVALDYTLSLLNIAFGSFIVWRRPNDWVARLLGLGMVGTAMAYNFQAHGILTVLRLFNVLHYFYHAISGSTYLHALVLFPSGKLVPRQFVWIIAITYFLMVEETVFPILKMVYGPSLFLPTSSVIAASGTFERFVQLLFSSRSGGMFVAFFDNTFQINNPLNNLSSILDAEASFFVLLFGMLVPIVGVARRSFSAWQTARKAHSP